MTNVKCFIVACTFALGIVGLPAYAADMTWQEHAEAAQAQWKFNLVDPVAPVSHILQALALARQTKVAPVVEGHLLDLLAHAYLIDQKRDLEEKTLVEALDFKEHNLGTKSAELVPTLYELADLRMRQGRSDEFLSLYRRGLSIQVTAFGGQSPEAAEALTMVGLAYNTLRKDKLAESYLRSAVTVARALPAVAEEARATTLSSLGEFLREHGRKEEADTLSEEAGAILLRIYAKKGAIDDGHEYAGLPRHPVSDVIAIDPSDPRWKQFQTPADGH